MMTPAEERTELRERILQHQEDVHNVLYELLGVQGARTTEAWNAYMHHRDAITKLTLDYIDTYKEIP